MTKCNVTLPCAPGTKLTRIPGECCQKCEEGESYISYCHLSTFNINLIRL